jgi:ribosomal-protein-alanine N-acetyltransferase
MNKKIILETERLRLREFTLSDAQFVFDLNDDPEVIRYVSDPACKDLDAARDVLETIILPQYTKYALGRWAVELKESGEAIGWCGIKFLADSGEYDLGYRYFRKHWRKGYGFEAAAASLEFGHSIKGLKKIVACAAVDNLGSIRVLEKIGMKFQAPGFDHDEPISIYASER